MARWTPPNNVGPNEAVGRRLFDEPMLVGAEGQKRFEGLDVRNFEEKRDGEVSLDRLGRSNVESAVKGYLLPRAVAAGIKFTSRRTFNGWAVLQAKQLAKPPVGPQYGGPVIASPVLKQDLEENVYHAHVATPAGVDYYSMALHLRHVFGKYGRMEQVADTGFWAAVKQWINVQSRRLSSLFARD